MRCPDQRQHQVLKANRAKQSRQRVKRQQIVRSLQEQNELRPMNAAIPERKPATEEIAG
jgi:hypothetical protein